MCCFEIRNEVAEGAIQAQQVVYHFMAIWTERGPDIVRGGKGNAEKVGDAPLTEFLPVHRRPGEIQQQ